MSAHDVKMQGTDPLNEVAARWHDRLQGENVSAETRADFERWRDSSPEHRQAYARVAEAWRCMKNAADDPGILALRHEAALRLTRKHTPARRWLSVAAACIAVVALSIAFKADWSMTPAQTPQSASTEASARTYRTAIGERLSFTLEDGSRITLNTDTQLEAAFNATERKIALTRGQALFEVAKDKQRPFIVEAQGQRFVAVGTAFDVWVRDAGVQLTMVEGVVKVEPDAEVQSEKASAYRTPREAILLTAGEQLSLEAGVQRVLRADAERVTSWHTGQVIFDNTRLDEAIVELNRYSDRKIELGDPSLSDLRLSGAFVTGRTGVFVEAVTTYFPVEITEESDRRVVLAARK